MKLVPRKARRTAPTFVESLESRKLLTTYSIQTSVNRQDATSFVTIDYSKDAQTAVVSFSVNTTFAASKNDPNDNIQAVQVNLNLDGGTVVSPISSGELTANGDGTSFSASGNLSPSSYSIEETVSWSNDHRGIKYVTAHSDITLANSKYADKSSDASQEITIPAGSLSMDYDDVPVGGGSDLTPLTLHASGAGGEYQLEFTDSGDGQDIKIWAQPDKSASNGDDHIVNADAPIYRIGNDNTTFDASEDTTVYIEGYRPSDDVTITLCWKGDPTTAPYNPSAQVSFSTYAVPTPTSITATLGGDSQTSSDATLGITDDNSYTVMEGSPAMTFKADGTSPLNENARSHIYWKIQEATDDGVQVTPPALSENTGFQNSLVPTAAGSFDVIVYFDKNLNKQYDKGEEQQVFRLNIVKITVTANSTRHGAGTKTSIDPNSSITTFDSAINNVAAFGVQYTISVVGGGGDGMRGTKKVLYGLVQNVTVDSETMHYDGGGVGTVATGLQNALYPILDSGSSVDPFATVLTTKDLGAAAGGGESYSFDFNDAPIAVFDQTHAFQAPNLPSQAELLTGGRSFINRLEGTSLDFSSTYVSYHEIDWNIAYNVAWQVDPVSNVGSWVDQGTTDAITSNVDTPNGAYPGVTKGKIMNDIAHPIYG